MRLRSVRPSVSVGVARPKLRTPNSCAGPTPRHARPGRLRPFASRRPRYATGCAGVRGRRCCESGGPWKRRSQAVRERKTSVLRACRVPNPAKRLNVVQRPKTLFVERLPRHGQRRRAGGPPGVTTARTSMAIECEHTPGRRTVLRQGQVLRVKALTIEKITVERDGEHHYSLGPARSTHDGHGPLKIGDVLGVAKDSAPNGDTLVKMPCGCDRILFAN